MDFSSVLCVWRVPEGPPYDPCDSEETNAEEMTVL